ncbi:MAG: DEAD/DEAH box helicase [Chromatiales bacterium]|nr:DEAD/DEAH box helicase [Chromatiales bacterium]
MTLDPYLILLGSTSYYLCDLPGSAAVLANHATVLSSKEDPYSMGRFLRYLLAPDKFMPPDNPSSRIDGYFFDRYYLIANDYKCLFVDSPLDGFDFQVIKRRIIDWAKDIRYVSYKMEGARQLLIADIICAIVITKIKNSAWECLPKYSGLNLDFGIRSLQKRGAIKEFRPAQHLLGKADVFKGKSAIVQMPTSAGKTKATELTLKRFSGRARVMAIIIALCRALCHEIKNSLVEAFHNESTKVDELSDALQTDFEIAELLGHQQILVVTPEKLLYVLRHAPELATHAGLLVFDEGHQFDSGTRGITYELFLTSLRSMIPESAQKVLISAVISNAEAIGEWLNGEPNVVEGTTLIPTFRSVGFASWIDQLGRIEYVDNRDAEQSEFFVPRVIERFNLGRKKRERT